MEDNVHFELNLYEMNNNNVGLPYSSDQLPKPNLCIPVCVKLFDRSFEIIKNAFLSILILIAGIIILITSFHEKSIIMLIFGLPIFLFGIFLLYNFVFKFILIESKDELILIKDDHFLVVYKKSKPDHQYKYDMVPIKGTWLSDSFTNGALNHSSICLSNTPLNYKKKDNTETPYLNYPEIHPMVEVIRCLNTIIIYDFIKNNFPAITIGYKEEN